MYPPADAGSCERCLSCKGVQVRRARAEGFRVAICGNGASDLCGAREADLVLARDILRAHCEREGIEHVPWEALREVRDAMAASLREGPGPTS